MYAVVPSKREFKGEKVIVRGLGNTKNVRALLDIVDRVAFVCDLDAYEAISYGERRGPIFGFPLEDVFKWTREAEFSDRPWDRATSLADHLGPERREGAIRVARARRNRRGTGT